jgi:hypothetical protein
VKNHFYQLYKREEEERHRVWLVFNNVPAPFAATNQSVPRKTNRNGGSTAAATLSK